jgi:hypothetical protein
MSDLEDMIGSPKYIKLGKKKLKHRELVLKDMAELKEYIKQQIEDEYKEGLKICESIPLEHEKEKAKSELIQVYLRARRDPESSELADGTAVHVYMLWLAIDKKVKLEDAYLWATSENLAIIQGEIEKN